MEIWYRDSMGRSPTQQYTDQYVIVDLMSPPQPATEQHNYQTCDCFPVLSTRRSAPNTRVTYYYIDYRINVSTPFAQRSAVFVRLLILVSVARDDVMWILSELLSGFIWTAQGLFVLFSNELSGNANFWRGQVIFEML